jgi:hypothetical protein
VSGSTLLLRPVGPLAGEAAAAADLPLAVTLRSDPGVALATGAADLGALVAALAGCGPDAAGRAEVTRALEPLLRALLASPRQPPELARAAALLAAEAVANGRAAARTRSGVAAGRAAPAGAGPLGRLLAELLALAGDEPAQGELRRAVDEVRRALARAARPAAGSRGEPELRLALPLALEGGERGVAHVALWLEGGGRSRRGRERGRALGFLVSLSLPGHGPIAAHGLARGRAIRLELRLDGEGAAERARAALGELDERLRRSGFDRVELAVGEAFPASPEAAETKAVDVHV